MKLPKGRDPDEIIRADPDGWRRFVIEAEAPKAFSAAAYQATPTEHGRKVAAKRKAPAAGEEKVDLSRAEETCLALLVRYPGLRGQGVTLVEDVFVGSENRQVFDAWRSTGAEASLREALSEELHPHLERIIARNLPPYDAAASRTGIRNLYGTPEKR